MIKFRVNGLPAPQGSKTRNRAGALYESSRAVGPWREAVRAEAQRTVEGLGWFETRPHEYHAVSVTLVFVLARPKSHFTGKGALTKSARAYPSIQPDLDKLVRATLDAMVAGGVMASDALVCSLSAVKVYASNGEAPGALIEVEAM